MSRPVVSIVFSTYQRWHLLARSLVCYENHEFNNDNLEMICVDDHSTDGTRDLVLDWSRRTGIKTVVLTVAPKYESWRDCGATLNTGIRVSTGKHVILTHPEVMPGKRSVQSCVDRLETFEFLRGPDSPVGLYSCCRPYYLSPQDQGRLDGVPWQTEGALAVRQIPGFYTEDRNGHPDYTHAATDSVGKPGSRLPEWGSFVFGGHSRETWKRLGGLCPTQRWGSVDVHWMNRRRVLGIPNHTCPDDETIVVHQSHDLPTDVKTPRVESVWREELSGDDLYNPVKLVWPYVDYL